MISGPLQVHVPEPHSVQRSCLLLVSLNQRRSWDSAGDPEQPTERCVACEEKARGKLAVRRRDNNPSYQARHKDGVGLGPDSARVKRSGVENGNALEVTEELETF